jgi:murein DD-endopeptidase MepM/ murein hydrolase activator NlpD
VGRKAVFTCLGMAVLLGSITYGARAARADDVASARAAATKAANQLNAAESALGRLSQQINTLEARKADAEQRLTALKASIRDIAIQRYINSDAEEIATLDPDINAQARADALSRFALRGNQDAIDEFTAAAQDLAVASKSLAERKSSQKAAVAVLRKRQADVQAKLKRLEQIEAQRKTASARASKAGRLAPAGPIATGAWVCPVQGARAFSNDFGAPRSGGRRHQGIDILSPRGTPTVAPVSGTVAFRGNSLGGLAWHLNGDDGNNYYGAHLEAYATNNSGHVAAGTVLGFVGNTGDAAGGATHLHFEIHPHGGGAINPYATLRQYC